MEENGDDFGDLYGGLDDQVYAGISSAEVPTIEGREDAEKNTSLASYPSIADKEAPTDRSRDNREVVVIEEDLDEVEDDENGSDSDDDIRIVLNDEDCTRFGAVEANHETGNGSECREKGGWICAVNPQSAGDGTEQREKGYYGITGGSLHHSQLKGFGHLSSPRSGKREGDASFKNEIAESYFASTAIRNLGVPAIIRNGYDFFLPRSRSIFDVNIEAFDWKPWSSHGADVTDYFNFGLNEDTWKSYCGSVDNFRKQNMLLSSSIPVKAFEPEQSHGAVALNLLPVEIGAISSFERPIGKAIQVEGGIGERKPSMEIKRFRNRDSDVVIQIKMEDTVEDASSFANFSPTSGGLDLKSKDNLVGSVAVDVNNGGLLSKQSREKSTEMANNVDLDSLLTEKKSNNTFEKYNGQSGLDNEVNDKMPSTENGIPKSPIGVDVGCDLNLSFLDSEESLNDASSDKNGSPEKNSSLDSVSGSEDSVISNKYLYDNLRCNKRSSQLAGTCSASYKHYHIRHKIKERSSSDSHVYSVEEAAHFARRKGKDLKTRRTGFDKLQQKFNFNNRKNYNGSSFSRDEIKDFIGYRNKFSSKDNKSLLGESLGRGNFTHHYRRNCNRSHSPPERSSGYRNGLHLKKCSRDKEHDYMERSGITAVHNKNRKSGSVKVPSYLKEGQHFCHRRKMCRGQEMEVKQDYAINHNHTVDAHDWDDDAILYYKQDRGFRNKFYLDHEEDGIHPDLEEKYSYHSRYDSEVDIDHRKWNAPRSHESRMKTLSMERDRFDAFPDNSFVQSSRKPRERQRGSWKASVFRDIISETSMEKVEDHYYFSERELRYDSPYQHRWLPDELTDFRCQEHDFYLPDLPFRASPKHVENGNDHLSISGRHSDNFYWDNFRNTSTHEKNTYYEARGRNNTFWEEELGHRPSNIQERKSRRGSRGGRASGKRKAVNLTNEPYIDIAAGNMRKEPVTHFPDGLVDQHVRLHDSVIQSNSPFNKSCVELPVRQEHDGSELEEGQLVEEPEDKDDGSFLITNSSVNEVMSHTLRNNIGRTQDNRGNNPDIVKSIESNRLLEALEKMQKRSERFKEPVSGKTDQCPDGPETPQLLMQLDPATLIDELKQRPARKRRWVG